MADKYTHDELVQQLDKPGWRTVSGEPPAEGTLRQVAEAAHGRRAAGGAAGLIQHIATRIEVDALQLEELWYHLGLPLA
jgi:hypothetical protein